MNIPRSCPCNREHGWLFGHRFLIDRMNGRQLDARVTLEKDERSELAELASNLL